jgi:hypothetical protein
VSNLFFTTHIIEFSGITNEFIFLSNSKIVFSQFNFLLIILKNDLSLDKYSVDIDHNASQN